MLPSPCAVEEIEASCFGDIDPARLSAETPWLARGMVADWPLVIEARKGPAAGLEYLQRFYRGRPISAFIAEPEVAGRFFYNDTLDGFNFTQVETTLDRVVTKLLGLLNESHPPSLYVGSTNIDAWLPGMRADNDLPLEHLQPLASLWLGNPSRVAAHFDFPRNIACCVAGRRRFTVFPPEQLANLYVGPWDLTPAGQPISLVDFAAPDLERFPRFSDAWASAQVAELGPGDILYLPGMWWHHVEASDSINALVNYWWSDTPAVMGSPVDAFTHALLSIKSLPPAQKRAWQAFFDHYIFATDTDAAVAHIPEAQRGRLGRVDTTLARRLRAELSNRIKR